MSSIKEQGEAMVTAVKGYVSRPLAPLATRTAALETRLGAMMMLRGGGSGANVEALEQRIAKLEARPQMSYRGVWTEGEENRPGDVATHAGSMWYCWAATKDRPGTSDAWQLCVKRGRDQR